MKRILVPVDFSDHTKTISGFAIEIAKKTGAEIRLFHAYFDFMMPSNTSFPYSVETNEIYNQEMIGQIRDNAIDEMHKLKSGLESKLEKDKIVNVTIVHTLTGGLPEEEILNISEIWAPDLIIMGTRGKGNKDILTGKVSSKVVQNASCRILTVPRNSVYRGFDHVLYATDFNDEDKENILKLIDLLSGYNSTIHCIHIDFDRDREADVDKMETLKHIFNDQINKGSISFDVIKNDDFLNGINEFVEKKRIDMIAVVHRRKSFLKRLFVKDHTRELLHHSNVPLYIFPEKQ